MKTSAWLGRAASWLREAAAHDPGEAGTRAARMVTWIVAFIFLAFAGWAALFHVDELARGQGKLIPANRVQPVQNQEGGVLAAMHVAEGQQVLAGQVLAEFDSKGLRADLDESHRRWLQALGAVARIEAQLQGRPLQFPPELAQAPAVRADEAGSYEANRQEHLSTVASLEQMLQQKQEQLARSRGELELRRSEEALLGRELDVLRPLVPEVLAATELMRKERELLNVHSAAMAQKHAVAELHSAIAQVQADLAKVRADYRSRLNKELAERRADVEILGSRNAARADKVARSRLVAPLPGVVKQVYFRTPGQVVPPAGVVLDVVPSEEALLIEAKLPPDQVGFLRVGQAVRVKVSSFDFSVFGALDGAVRNISADTVQERDGREFYLVHVAMKGELKDRGGRPLPLSSGMTVNVDIVTGTRSVLTYLLKPIVRGLNQSLTER